MEFYKAMSMRREVIPMDFVSRAVTPDLPLGVMRPGIIFSSTGKQNNQRYSQIKACNVGQKFFTPCVPFRG